MPATSGWRLRSNRSVGVVLAAAGLALTVAGMFLPWVASGGVLRNSYAIVGIVQRIGIVRSSAGSLALSLWPFVGPATMLAWIAGILRLWRTAATITLVIGLLTGVVGAGVLAVAGGHSAAGVGVAYPGPVVTVIGATCAVIGSAVVLIDARRTRRTRRPGDLSPTSRISAIGSGSFPSEYQQ